MFKVGDRVRQIRYSSGENSEAIITAIEGNQIFHQHKGSGYVSNCSLFDGNGKCCFELAEKKENNIKVFGIIEFCNKNYK